MEITNSQKNDIGEEIREKLKHISELFDKVDFVQLNPEISETSNYDKR